MPLLSTVGRAHDASTTRPPPPSRYKGLALNLIKNPLATGARSPCGGGRSGGGSGGGAGGLAPSPLFAVCAGVSLTVNDCVKDMLRPYRRRAEGR